MSPGRKATVVRWAALGVGLLLFAGTLAYMDLDALLASMRRMGLAIPLALFFSGLWHLTRTWAWAWCFPSPRRVSFLRLVRVRLAAEAFSYLTLRGIAGEPLKVVLLNDRVDPREATAAVALERIAYMVGTMLIVGIGSLLAILALPLTRLWFRVFRAFTIASAVMMLLAVMVITGRGTYVYALFTKWDRRFGTNAANGRVARFISAVERQVLDLVRGNPARLAVLLIATVVSYLFMALEAWAILQATGTPVSAIGALTIETFSRVASFASAFIPMNLGALEASSLAAVTAVGAAGGGAALALARRVRGLFWAGLGLAIFPRHVRRPGTDAASEHRTLPPGGPVLLYLMDDADVRVPPHVRLAGLPLNERIVRAALRAGYARVIVWSGEQPPGNDRGIPGQLQGEFRRRLEVVASDEEWFAAVDSLHSPVTIVGAGTLVSPALLSSALGITASEGSILDVPAGDQWPVSGVLRVAAGDARDRPALLGALAARRREGERPNGEDVSHGRAHLSIRLTTPDDVARAEATLRRSSYKDTDAKIARFNRRMSLPISVALMRTPITANQISVALVALGFYSAWLFSLGEYWPGVLAGFLSLSASVLDGCDGEIARLKYQESALGCWIETFGDYSYYFAIFVGLTIGAVRQTGAELFYWIGAAALIGTAITFALLIYLRARITNGQPNRLHTVARERFKSEPTFWSRIIWRISFVATRAAMPYGIMAFALVNALPGIVILAAIGANVYWVSLVLKLRDLLRGEREAVA